MTRTNKAALAVIATLVAVVIVAVAIIAGVSNAVTATFDSFSKVAGVWIAVIPSLVAAGASIFVLFEQQKASAELEKLKTKLSTELEAIKGRLAAERKAYDELHAAAILYYYTLARLEAGSAAADQLAKADESMLAACRYTAFVKPADRDAWMRLWQAARALNEKAAKAGDAQAPQAVWAKNCAALGTHLAEFSDAVTQAHEAP